ncbi:MAG: hypothetical protein RLY93_07965 [Sumerlaeia bacterium]
MDESFSSFEASQALPLGLGIALLLFGWLLYRLVIGAAGGILGGVIGLGFGGALNMIFRFDPPWDAVCFLGGMVLGALLGIAVFQFLNRLAFFLLGAAICGWAFTELYPLFAEGGEEAARGLLFAAGILVSAIVGGLLAIFLTKYVIALASVAAGTLLVGGALDWPYDGLLAIPIFLIGLGLQLAIVRPWSKKDDDGD